MDFPLTNVAISPGFIPVNAKNTSIAWKKYNGSKMMMRITILSSQALMEIVRDMEMLIARRLPLHDPTSPHRQATLMRKANKTVIRYPHTTTEEEVFHFTFLNDQIAQSAVGALRPYFNILRDENVPASNSGNKRQRQSQGQEHGRPPPPPPTMPHMYNFAHSDNPDQNHSYPATHSITRHHTQMGVQPGDTYVYGSSPTMPAGYGTGRELLSSSTPLAHPIPFATAERYQIHHTNTTTQHPTTPLTNTAEPIPEPAPEREESPPPLESLGKAQGSQQAPSGQSQLIDTQQSVKGSSGSRSDKDKSTNTSLPLSNNRDSQVIDTQDDKTRSSTVTEGDLLNIYDDDFHSSGSGGLQINHPPLDPYEGTPWARPRYCDESSSQAQGRPNQYIDAGVYSMTEDQLDGMIGEIVLEAGFQSFCERVFRVMDTRYLRDSREMDDFEEDF